MMLCLQGTTLQANGLTADSAIVEWLKSTFDIKFTDNNRVVVFRTGQEKFDDMFETISQARHSVHLEYFNFRNDSISNALFDLLKKKASEGVEVRAVFDGFGNSSNNKPLRKHHLKSLRAAGIEICEFDPVRFPYFNHALRRDHRKVVVVDGLVAYTGGMNVADYYIHGKPEFGEWRDIHMRIEGEAVGTLQGVFLKFWNLVSVQEVKGPQYYPGGREASDFFNLPPDTTATAGRKLLGIVNKEPGSPKHIIKDVFIEAIDGAQKQIQIINPYFTLSNRVRKALKRAARRGVDVQVMVSEKCDIPMTPRLIERNTKRLMDDGVRFWFYQGGFHHSKIMMVDSIYSFVGSANLNSRSLRFDYECNVLIADVPTTHHLQRIFEEDKQERCFQMTPEIYKSFSAWRRFKGWFLQIFTPFVHNDAKPWDASGEHPDFLAPWSETSVGTSAFNDYCLR